MLVVVTGGAGFIGSHVVDALLEAGFRVAVIDDLSGGDRRNLPAGVPLYVEDVTRPGAARVLSELKPGYLVHLAAQVSAPASMDDPVGDCRANVLGTVRILQAAAASGCRKAVIASSAAVYGSPIRLPIPEDHPLKPLCFYGVSKVAGERYASAYSEMGRLECSVLRFANVYGPRQGIRGEGGVVAAFTGAVVSGETPVIHGDGTQTRDFVFVRDVAKSVLMALGGPRGTYNVSTGVETSIGALFEMVASACGVAASPLYGDRRDGDIVRSALDPSLARRELGWAAERPLSEGLKETVSWWKSFRAV